MNRVTVKEIKTWMKTLEENRYKKTYHSDARRVSWLVNNNLSEYYEDMPNSMRKKCSKAAYGRERQLAVEFLKHKRNEAKLKESIRKIKRKQYSEYIFNKCAINTTTYTKQMRETVEFLEQAKQYVDKHDDEIMFSVIQDGDYFDKNISKLDQYVCDRVIVCDSDKCCKK